MENPAGLDVFISYSRDDLERARWFAEWCQSHGWSVWWDQVIAPGRKWDEAIERALSKARCVLVLWSTTSLASDWVRTEASEAVRRGVFVPVLIDRVEPPLEFRRVQALDLSGWDGRSDEPALRLLRSALAEHVGAAASTAVAPLPVPRSTQSNRWMAGAAVLATIIALGIWQWLPHAAPVAEPAAAVAASAVDAKATDRFVEATRADAGQPHPAPEAKSSAALDRPLRQPVPPVNKGRAGADVARVAEEQRQALLDKADQSRAYWADVLKDEGGGLLLEQAVLLAVEAVRRGGGVPAEAVLRRSLALLSQPLRTLAHEDRVRSVAFSPDGHVIATASNDWTAALWDPASGRKIATLQHQDVVNHVAFSSDGRYVATASSDKTARLWQASDGKELARLMHGGGVSQVSFSGDGRAIATRTYQGSEVPVWSVPEGSEIGRIVSPEWMVEVVLSDDGRYLIGRGSSGKALPAQVWDVKSGERVAQLSVGSTTAESVATHRDVVAVGESSGIVSLWRLGSWSPLGQVHEVPDPVTVDLSVDARLLVSGSAELHGKVAIAPVSDGVRRATSLSTRKNDRVRNVVLSVDGARVVATAQDKTAVVIDVRNGEELLRAQAPGTLSIVPQAALSPNGRLLLTAGAVAASLWEVTPADPVRTACARVKRNLTAEEWKRWFDDEPWRKTCAG